jgi:hypothetical protein
MGKFAVNRAVGFQIGVARGSFLDFERHAHSVNENLSGCRSTRSHRADPPVFY